MEFGDAEKWNPLLEAFNDQSFNTYMHAAAAREVSSDTVVELFVAGIPPCMTEQGLANLMSSAAKIQRVALVPHRNIGFVSVRQKDAVKVIGYFNNYKVDDNYLTVRISKPKKRMANERSSTVSGTTTRIASEADKEGKTTNSSIFRHVDELKIPALSYPTAAKHVQVGQVLAVKVLNVISPSQFWICRHSYDSDGQLEELHTKMQKHYSSLRPKSGLRPNGSGLYAAPKRDSGNWCRVQALNFDTESVSVLLLDYGTCDQVSLTNLHSLEGQFLSLPFRAICCNLAHVQCTTQQWSDKAVNCMHQLLSNEQVSAKVCGIDEYTLSVELILFSGQTVNDELVRRGCASRANGTEPSSVQANTENTIVSDTACRSESSEDTVTDYPTIKDMEYKQLAVGECYDVIVLHARNASDVTVCLKSGIDELRTLIMELCNYELSDWYVPHVGEIVAAQYAADGCCYRAEVLSLYSDTTAVVHFVDFGNEAAVSLKSLVQLQPRHLAFPIFGINVKFSNSDVDSKLLAEYSSLNLKVVEQRGNRYVVSLTEDDTESPSNQPMCSVSDLKQCCLDTRKTYKAWVTNATDAEKFHVQVQEFDYIVIDEQLQAIYSSKSGGYEPQQSGELIAVHLDVDDMWYRAVVKEIEDRNAVKCELIDFGIFVTTTSKNICHFNCQLLTYPVVAFKCSFHNAVVSAVDSWKDEYLKPMMELYNMTVVEVKGDLHFVELVHVESAVDWKQKLIDDGILVKARSGNLLSAVSPTTTDKLSSDEADHFAKSEPDGTKSSCNVVKSEPLLPFICDTEVRSLHHNRERIVVVHANSPSDFYIQSGSDCVQKKLGSIQQSLDTFCRQPSSMPDAIAVGQIVGVMHSNVWYRGEVVDVESHGKFQVHFVDIGITKIAKSAELRPLPDDLALSLPRQAIHCAISPAVGCDAGGSWSAAAVKSFQNFCENRDLILKFIIKNDSGSTWLVDLLHVATGRTAKDVLAQQLITQRTGSSNDSKSVSKYCPDLRDDDRKHLSGSGKTSPPLLSSMLKNASIQQGETVTVTCIHSPCDFFVQHQHHSSAQLLQELNTYCKAHDQVYRPKQVGELIAVMHSDQWYRAEVLSLSADSASVFFIDHGNTTDVDLRNIRALPSHFATALPRLAINCALGGISGTSTDGSYSEAAVRWFKDNYLQVASTVTRVKCSDTSGALLINLRNSASTKTARQSLFDYGMALISTGTAPNAGNSLLHSQPSIQPQCNMPYDIALPCAKPTAPIPRQQMHFQDAQLLQVDAVVCVVHVISPVDFYVLPSDPAALQDMMSLSEKLEQYCNTSNSTGYCPQYVGEPVAAKFEGEWCRAEVLKLTSSDCSEVFFVDFGNTAVVGAGDLRSVGEEFVKRPKQAVHCATDGVCGTDIGQGFTEAAVEWFKKFCCGSTVTVSSVRNAGGKNFVNMSVKGDSAKELLVAAGFAANVMPEA